MDLTWFDKFIATPGRMAPLEGGFLYALALAAARWTSAGHMVELGAYRGRSACAIGEACRQTGQKLTCVDNWSQTDKTTGSSRADFERHVADAGLTETVDIVEGDSAEVGKKWTREALSMVFIDAAHDYASVKADFEAWFPHVQRSGIIAFHDSGATGVSRLLEEITKRPDLIWVGKAGSVTALQRK